MSVTEEKFSGKFDKAAGQPDHRGAHYQEDAKERGMALVEAKYKDTKFDKDFGEFNIDISKLDDEL